MLTSGRLGAAPLEFAVHMVRACIIMEPVLTSADLFNTLEVLAKLARTSPQQGPALQLLVEQARRPKCALLCYLYYDYYYYTPIQATIGLGASQQRFYDSLPAWPILPLSPSFVAFWWIQGRCVVARAGGCACNDSIWHKRPIGETLLDSLNLYCHYNLRMWKMSCRQAESSVFGGICWIISFLPVWVT